jgi:hypothetical protein
MAAFVDEPGATICDRATGALWRAIQDGARPFRE